MKTTLAIGILLLPLLTVSLQAQSNFGVYGQVIEERASTRLGYWYRNVNAGLGEVVISYGRPPWKEQYAQQLDQMTNGKMWRMGDNYWTLLDTNLPVEIGGVKVPVGLYYLAVKRSQDGSKWELVFIDPDESRQKWLDSYDVGTRPDEIPVLFSAPLTFEENEGDKVEKLTILLKLDAGSQNEGRMRLTWGNLALTTPVKVQLR